MRDLDGKALIQTETIVSMKEFAELMNCSVDTAKRWLTSSPNKGYVKVVKTKGRHWRIVLPYGQSSAAVCRLLRLLETLFHRKPGARQAMPFAIADSRGGRSARGVENPCLWWDLNSLICQVLQELGADVRKKKVFVSIFEKFASHMNSANDEVMRRILASLVVTQTVYKLQKLGETITVQNIAKFIGMSESAIYLPPFGKDSVKAVMRSAEAGLSTESQGDTRQAFQMGLSVKRKEMRTYSDRKEERLFAKEAATRHFLCWYGSEVPGLGRMATLCLVPELSIPEELRPRYPVKAKRGKLPNYSKSEVLIVTDWLQNNVPGNWEGIGNISPSQNGKGYEWHVNFGVAYKGAGATWEEATNKMLELIKPEQVTKTLIILNGRQEDEFAVPENFH